jgi:hypothetical protein
MATKKTTAKKDKETSATVKKGGTKKVTTRKTQPTEEEIRMKAEEIYHERIARGEYGTAEDDWHKAETLLKGTRKK